MILGELESDDVDYRTSLIRWSAWASFEIMLDDGVVQRVLVVEQCHFILFKSQSTMAE
jgi:hypothetical protein